MRYTSEKLLADARAVAEEMLRRGEEMREVPFGKAKDCIFVSIDPDKLRYPQELSVNNMTIYMGTKKCHQISARYASPTDTIRI